MKFTVDPADANPQSSGPGLIDITVTHPHLGKVRYTAASFDPTEPDSEELYQRALAGEFGPVAPALRNLEREWSNVRETRNQLLRASDWTQAPDAPVNRSTWAAYRQALRDITESAADPDEIVWPRIEDFEQAAPDWRGFLNALRGTSVFTNLRSQARQDVAANALATELRTNLGEAAQGYPTVSVIQQLVNELYPSLTTQQVAEIQTAITAFKIPLTVQ